MRMHENPEEGLSRRRADPLVSRPMNPASPSSPEIEIQGVRILGSRGMVRSPMVAGLFRYLLGESLAGHPGGPKQSRKQGRKLVIRYRLLDGSDGTHLWARKHVLLADSPDFRGFEERLVREVALELGSEFGVLETRLASLARVKPNHLWSVFEAVLCGRMYFTDFSRELCESSLAALTSNPPFARKPSRIPRPPAGVVGIPPLEPIVQHPSHRISS